MSIKLGQKITKVINPDLKSIVFSVRDYTEENTFTVIKEFTVWAEDLEGNLPQHAMMHGLSQKVGDAGASEKGTSTMVKFNKMLDEWSRIKEEKSWNKKSRSGSGPKVKVIDMVKVLANANTPVETIALAAGLSVEAVQLIIDN